MGSGPHFTPFAFPHRKMKPRKQTSSLAGQVVAVNVLLVVATPFAARAAPNLDPAIKDQRWSFAPPALPIVLVLLLKMLMLRPRFGPLRPLRSTTTASCPQWRRRSAASPPRPV